MIFVHSVYIKLHVMITLIMDLCQCFHSCMNLLLHEKCLAVWCMEEKPHNVVKQKYRKLQFFLSAFISIKLQRTVFWKCSIICRDVFWFFFTDRLTSTCLNSASLRWSFYIMLLIFYRWSANNCFFLVIAIYFTSLLLPPSQLLF